MKKFKTYLRFLKTPKGLLAIAVALLALWLAAGFFSPIVDVAPVKKQSALWAVTGTLKVIAAREVVVKTQVDGRLTQLSALEASGKRSLKAGEVFAALDSTALDREIALYQARKDTTEKQIEIGSDNELEIINLRGDLNTAETLFANGQLSKNELDRRRRALEKLERAWQKEHLDLERELADAQYELQSRLDKKAKMELRSPIDGEMCALYVVEGQVLPPECPVALIRSKELSLEVSLSEEDFPGIEVGQRATLSFTGIGGTFQGHVTALAAYGNPETRRRSAFVSLETPSELIVPGSTGYATIIKAERAQALTIPRRGLFGNTVFVHSWGHLHRRIVQLGYQSFSTIEIVGGLSGWDSVALAGDVELHDGMRVKTRRVKP